MINHSIQNFIKCLNAKEMPQIGYKFHDGEWRWPEYDWDNHEYSDFDSKDYIESQKKRLGKYKFKSEKIVEGYNHGNKPA